MPKNESEKESGLNIIHVVLLRMGTVSLALAYRKLGYKVHHGINTAMDVSFWHLLEEAVEATRPDVPIVIARRPLDPWWESYQPANLDVVFNFLPRLIHFLIRPISYNRGPATMRKFHLGFFGVKHQSEINRECAGKAYDNYRRLEYQLGDGWGPLCEFLGRDVPRGDDGDKELFPCVNHRLAHREQEVRRLRVGLRMLREKLCRIF
ncbi:hypothetical protein F5Y16DRAFT_418846 [Xylariaceae sp. FL0255]|nr:hypothetical protein F5Y16DRAFT_418846 [Xylariaceae sp. FL0255]